MTQPIIIHTDSGDIILNALPDGRVSLMLVDNHGGKVALLSEDMQKQLCDAACRLYMSDER